MPHPPAFRTGRLHATLVLGVALGLVACGDDDDSPTPVAEQRISAAEGATLQPAGTGLEIMVPPGALTTDAVVTVEPIDNAPPLQSGLQAAGPAYSIEFSDGATLNTPLQVRLPSNASPTHPTLAQLARRGDDGWEIVPASFYRASDQTVLGLVSEADDYRVVLRTLQSRDGDDVARGRQTFLEETFGNEAFFGGTLGLHTLLNGLTPTQAVENGVQIDITKVPQAIAGVLTGNDFAAKQTALQDPMVTRALLKAGAVIGVRTFYADPNSDVATSAGVTCALCHVNAAPTMFELQSGQQTALPIGEMQLDGVPNTTMDAGRILSLTPFVQNAGQALVDTLASWGPGNFDVRALPDNPLDDNVVNPTNVPPLWNFLDLAEQGYAFNWDGLFKSEQPPGDALASQAEAVYDLAQHANGAFGTPSGSLPPVLRIEPPAALVNALVQAETETPGNVIDAASLRDVQAWQQSLVSPAPGNFDEALAEQGFLLFNGKAGCAGCHATPEFTGSVFSTEITLEPPMGGLANGIKTPGLRGLAQTAPYFHDGSAATLADVLDVYSGRVVPMLSDAEKSAVVEYLKTL